MTYCNKIFLIYVFIMNTLFLDIREIMLIICVNDFFI